MTLKPSRTAYIVEREAAHHQAKAGKAGAAHGWDVRWRDRWIQFKVSTGHAGDAARWLNGQNEARINHQFAYMTPAEVSAIREAAPKTEGVGAVADINKYADAWLEKHPVPADEGGKAQGSGRD